MEEAARKREMWVSDVKEVAKSPSGHHELGAAGSSARRAKHAGVPEGSHMLGANELPLCQGSGGAESCTAWQRSHQRWVPVEDNPETRDVGFKY